MKDNTSGIGMVHNIQYMYAYMIPLTLQEY